MRFIMKREHISYPFLYVTPKEYRGVTEEKEIADLIMQIGVFLISCAS